MTDAKVKTLHEHSQLTEKEPNTKTMKTTTEQTATISPTRLRSLAWAVTDLGEALSCRQDSPDCVYMMENHASKALRNITNFFEIELKEETTSEENEWSSMLHTWLRKCDDTPLGTVIYRFWRSGTGPLAWFTLIRILMSDEPATYDRIEGVLTEFHTDGDLNMWGLIRAFASLDEGWLIAQENIREWRGQKETVS